MFQQQLSIIAARNGQQGSNDGRENGGDHAKPQQRADANSEVGLTEQGHQL